MSEIILEVEKISKVPVTREGFIAWTQKCVALMNAEILAAEAELIGNPDAVVVDQPNYDHLAEFFAASEIGQYGWVRAITKKLTTPWKRGNWVRNLLLGAWLGLAFIMACVWHVVKLGKTVTRWTMSKFAHDAKKLIEQPADIELSDTIIDKVAEAAL